MADSTNLVINTFTKWIWLGKFCMYPVELVMHAANDLSFSKKRPAYCISLCEF